MDKENYLFGLVVNLLNHFGRVDRLLILPIQESSMSFHLYRSSSKPFRKYLYLYGSWIFIDLPHFQLSIFLGNLWFFTFAISEKRTIIFYSFISGLKKKYWFFLYILYPYIPIHLKFLYILYSYTSYIWFKSY